MIDRSNNHFNTDKGKFSSWILTITRNAALDCLRREKRQPTIEVEERDGGFDEPVERTVMERETASEVRNAVSELKPDQQELIELVYFGDIKEKILYVSENAPIKFRVHVDLNGEELGLVDDAVLVARQSLQLWTFVIRHLNLLDPTENEGKALLAELP